MRSAFPAVTALVLAQVVPSPTRAQSLWTDPRVDQALTLELLKPDFNGPSALTLATSVTVISLRLPVGPRVRLVGQVPLAHYGLEEGPGFGGLSENAVGNPYVGLEVGSPDSRVFGEFGLRLPAAPSNEASLVGGITDVDRLDAFARDVLPVTAVANYRFGGPTGVVTRLRAGPSLWIDVGDAASESELMFSYSGQVGYQGRVISLLGGLSGLMGVTQEGLNLGERTFHQLGVALSAGSGRVRPGAHIRLPLDQDLNDALDLVIGLTLTVALR